MGLLIIKSRKKIDMEISKIENIKSNSLQKLENVQSSSFSEHASVAMKNFEESLTRAINSREVDSQFDSSINKTGLTNIIKDFSSEWQEVYQQNQFKLSKLSGEHRELVELQMRANKLNLVTNLATKAADTVSSTLKKVNQLGAS